ncbi:hypothetical protein SAY86_004671 [Trapa natans]|uniref:Uncharacterized protein n=1 Tax=Trapa natans TaxID=22666 RepID=A0AAN7MGI7_TRANT|nr:hypothetical protein SAY86_004671 [Trapa natans]
MAEERWGLASISLCVATAVLGLLSALSCIASELKRTKEDELKLDGKLCYLPGNSGAYMFGAAALTFLCAAQAVGNLGIVTNWACWRMKIGSRSNDDKRRRMVITAGLLAVSWVSFLIAVTLIGAATSMNREQGYGRGWLDGECYTVKRGVYLSSAALALVATGCIIGSASSMRNSGRRPPDRDGDND